MQEPKMSKKDNYNIKEGIFDRFRQLWSREQEADQSDPQGDTSPPEITGLFFSNKGCL